MSRRDDEASSKRPTHPPPGRRPSLRARGVYSRGSSMPARHHELQHYVRLTEDDKARVVASAIHLAPHYQHVSDVFYERIREHEDAHAVFEDEAQIHRLRASLVRWMTDLFTGPHDDAHFARTERIGQVHVNVGLPARYMVSAMAVVRDEIVRLLRESGLGANAASVALLLDVELAVMLDAYWEHYTTRTRDLSRAARLGASGPADMTLIVEELGVIVVGLDGEHRVVLFNDEAERTTGYAADEILGRRVDILFPREDSDMLAARIAETERSDRPITFDASLITRLGRVRDVRCRTKRAQKGPSGLAIFLTAADVTEELALQRRTQKAERLAAIGRLAAGLAHEIRNPLNGAHLHLALLDRQLRKSGASDGDESIESVSTVSHEVQRLSTLVTEFLQFARPQPLTLRPVVLGEVCAHAARLLGPDAERSGVELALDLPLTPIEVRADPDKLAQVLLNLVRNAIEAIAGATEADDARRGPVGRVVIRVRRQPRDAFIEVEDDGPGIADDNAPIFDAFFSTKAAGTGLGLSIAHRIVQDHDGALTFETRDADGRVDGAGARRARTTVFRIKLPLLAPEPYGEPEETNA